MRKSLLVAAVCILTLPLWFSASPRDNLASSAPFVTVIYAGHTTGGDWCESGTPGCISGNSRYPGGNRDSAPSDQQNDTGTGVLVLALAFFLWTRLRA